MFAAISKNVNISLTNSVMLSAFGKKIWIVNTLCARYNFLTSHKHVVRIGYFLQCKIDSY